MSKRYVPRTYNNRRLLRILFGSVVSVLLAAVILFIMLFFWLRRYRVPSEDGIGVRLEIPWLMDDTEPKPSE